jgi:nucleoside-diphosphate-sugar epimerase
MKKLLITGSNGFVGKNLVEFYSNRYHIIEQNRSVSIDTVLAEQPEFIINCAASIYEEAYMFDSNVSLVHKLINYVKINNAKMIHIGSSAEYGRKSHATKETDYLDPTTLYEATKSAATMLCVGYARAYNLSIAVARPYSVYGKYEKSYRLFHKLYNAFIKNEPMSLYNGFHDFIYIKDFIKGIDTLLHADHDIIKGDVVNFGSGKQYSNFQILDIFKSILKQDAPITIHNSMSKSFESETWVCDTTYSQQKYNFKCDYDIKNGIIDYIKSMK